MMTIEYMTGDDISFALSLTNTERWANVKDDFERLIDLDPIGNFVARENDLRVGMITTVRYGQLAFMGNLIVDEKYRGRGIGQMLMQKALKYLEGQNISTIELDGDFPAVSLYRRLGFRDKYLSLRFIRDKSISFEAKRKIDSGIVDPEKIIRTDHKLTGISRDEFIRSFIERHQGQIYLLDKGKETSYTVVRKRYGDFFTIGPTMSKSVGDARILFESAISDYCSFPLIAGVPETNRKAVKLMLDFGFYYNKPSLRMYKGERLDYESNIFSIIAGDVG